MNFFAVVLLFSSISLSHSTEEEDASLFLYFNNEVANIGRANDSIRKFDEITQLGKDETTTLPDLNIGLPENEDWVWYPAENSDTARNNNEQLNVIDNNQIIAYIENEIRHEISNNNTIKEPFQSISKNKKDHYVEDALFYILSRLCYDIRIGKKQISKTYFGHQIYGDDKKEFRKKFGIRECSFNNKQYYKIDNYFHKKTNIPEKRCLPNINEEIATYNILYWESKIKKHLDFEELKNITDNLLKNSDKASLGEAAFFYLLSRLCYEIRIQKRDISQTYFGHQIYGDDKKEFRKKFNIREAIFNRYKKYYSISHYFNSKKKKSKKQCLENITKTKAFENIEYWEAEARKHPDFFELKHMVDIITANKDSLGKTAIYYIFSRLCYERRIAKKGIKLIEFGHQIYGDDKKEFRIKFNIEDNFPEKGQYSIISNYFNQKGKKKEKQCLENITKTKAIENIKYWEAEAKTHADFEELKSITETLLANSDKASIGEAALYYILSRLCYELRIKKKDIKLTEFGHHIYGDDKNEFRKKFGIRQNFLKNKHYSNINNYFYKLNSIRRKQCLKNITKEIAADNIAYWETQAKKHPDFEELNNITHIFITSGRKKAFNI